MSMRTWTINGIGFDTSLVPAENYREFLKAHKDSAGENKNTIESLLKEEYDDEFLYHVVDVANCTAYLIACIMTEETGIWFDAPCADVYDRDCVLFLPKYSWNLNEKERVLTEDELYDIMQKYADELKSNERVMEYELEYFG